MNPRRPKANPDPLLSLGAAVLFAVSCAAMAQADPETSARRAVIEREQQSEAFSLQLRQSQQRLQLSRGSPQERGLESLHLAQRQRQQALMEEQLRQFALSGPSAVAAGQLSHVEARFERERRAQDRAFDLERLQWAPVLQRPRR